MFCWRHNSYSSNSATSRTFWTIKGLLSVPLVFQPKMKNWIYRYSTGFLNFTSAITNSVILLGIPNAQRNLFPIINIYSISGQNGLQSYCYSSYSRDGVNQMWILKNSKDLLEYIQSRSLSSWNSIKTFDISTLYTTIPQSKLKDRLKELVQLCFIKKKIMANIDTNTLFLRTGKSLFVKKKSILPKVL
jgi:hypothetical protein